MRPRHSWVAVGLLMVLVTVNCCRRCGRRVFQRCTVLSLILLLVLAGAAAAGTPAKIGLTRETGGDGQARVTAVVTDAEGTPVEGAAVTFRVKTAFGWLTVAEVESRSDGTAAIVLPPTSLHAEISADAGEGDMGMLAASVARPEPAVRPGRGILGTLSPQPGLISPYPPPQILFVALILGGIWTTYAYLVFLLVRLRRAGRSVVGRHGHDA